MRLPTSQRHCCQRANCIQRGFYVRQLMTHIFECALQRQIQEILNETHVHSNRAIATAKWKEKKMKRKIMTKVTQNQTTIAITNTRYRSMTYIWFDRNYTVSSVNSYSSAYALKIAWLRIDNTIKTMERTKDRIHLFRCIRTQLYAFANRVKKNEW